MVINPIDGPPALLRNVSADHHHWVELKLHGGPKSPRDAVGATVYLTANGMRQRQDVMSGGSYVSTNDQRPHFGLGDATDAGTAEIHWPSGAKETVTLPAVDRIFTITEGKGITATLCGDANHAPTAVPASPGSKPSRLATILVTTFASARTCLPVFTASARRHRGARLLEPPLPCRTALRQSRRAGRQAALSMSPRKPASTFCTRPPYLAEVSD